VNIILKLLQIFAVGVAIAFIALIIGQSQTNHEIAQIQQTLQPRSPASEAFSPDLIADLPEPVQRYFRQAIAPGTPLATSVQLTMQGQIRLSPEQDWMPLQAQETLSTQGFIWQAIAGKGVLQMRGADFYTQGNGRMRFSLWGLIPLINVQNPDVTRSGIGRWIGEYFWLPSALLPQRGVSWKAIDDDTIQASLNAAGEAIDLTFVIDSQGKVLQASLLRWGDQTLDKRYAKIPFGGSFQAHQTFGGYTIPTQMGAGWWIGTERYFEFFQVKIDQAEFL
jgi:hypothetical protein